MQSNTIPREQVATHFLRDASAVVFDETSQALFAFDHAAAYLWCRLTDGGDRDDLIRDLAKRTDLDKDAAGDIVDGCLADWQRLALLGEGSGAAPADGPEPPAQPRRTAFAAAAARHGLVVAGVAYELRCETAAIAAALEPLLATFPTFAPDTVAEADMEGRIDVTAGAAGAEIYIDGWQVGDGGALEDLGPAVKFCLTNDRVEGGTREIALHAGAVTTDDGGATTGVLLAGPAGSGKSTLGAGLMAAGWGHLADDTVLFDADSGRFRGFGFAVGIKEAAWPVMIPRAPELARAPTFMRADGLAVRFLQRRQPIDTAIEVGVVVFPTYRHGASLHTGALDTGTALRRLLAESGSGAGRLTGAMFHSLVAWLDGARALTLTYGDLDEAVAAVGVAARAG